MKSSALYEELGVPRNATKAQIRKAYRGRAKKAHPDAGGKPEDFQRLQLAHDTLMNDNRRARYDQTGDAGEREPDNAHAQVIERVANAIQMALQHAEKTRENPLEVNILDLAKSKLKGRVEEVTSQLKDIKKQVKLQQRAAAKFKKAKGSDIIGQIMAANIAGLQAVVVKAEAEIATCNQALEMFTGYTFEPDATAPAAPREPSTFHIRSYFDPGFHDPRDPRFA